MAPQGNFQPLNQTDDISSHVPTVYSNDFHNHWQGSEKVPEPYVRSLPDTTKEPLSSLISDQPLMTPLESQSPPPLHKKPKRQRTGESTLSRYASSLWSRVPYRAVSHLAAPLFAAPWRHEPCEDLGGSRGSTVRTFDRTKQRRRSFNYLLLQWFLTIIFCGVNAGVLYHYDSQQTISQTGKYLFNSSFLGVSLLLSFAVAGGLKEYATIFRWRLLSQNWRSLQEFELVMGVPSQRKALRLIWVAERWQTKLICFCYVFIHVGLQVAIALLGLCQSIDTSTTWVDTIPGNVSIVNLQVISQAYDSSYDAFETSVLAETGSANIFGIGSADFGVVNATENDIDSRSQTSVFGNGTVYGDVKDWTYYFVDWCPDTGCQTNINTDRSISSTAVCVQHNITSGGYANTTNVTWTYPNGKPGWLGIPDASAQGVTTWFSDLDYDCGPRCVHVYALGIGITDDDWPPQLFECNNTLGHVANISDTVTNQTLYDIPNDNARYFAGAIGFNGLNYSGGLEYHVYDTSSYWSATVDEANGYNWTISDAANRIMQFSVGAIAAMDENGQRIYVYGDSPIPAESLTVVWLWAIVILSVIPGIQFACLLLTVALGSLAVVKDESFLAAARLLRPIVERLENNGCALTGDEICEVLGNPRVAYGLRAPHNATDQTAYHNSLAGDELMHLDVLRERTHAHTNMPNDMGWRVGRPMPQGRYDGLASRAEEEKLGLLSGSPVDTSRRKRRTSF